MIYSDIFVKMPGCRH